MSHIDNIYMQLNSVKVSDAYFSVEILNILVEMCHVHCTFVSQNHF